MRDWYLVAGIRERRLIEKFGLKILLRSNVYSEKQGILVLTRCGNTNKWFVAQKRPTIAQIFVRHAVAASFVSGSSIG